MKRKLSMLVAFICAVICACFFGACVQRDFEILKVDGGNGVLDDMVELEDFTPDQLDEVMERLSGLTFYFVKHSDNSAVEADRSKLKTMYIGPDGFEYDGLPTALQEGYYQIYYYCEGHKPVYKRIDGGSSISVDPLTAKVLFYVT